MADSLRILWLKTGPLHPLDTGGKIRTYNMLRELKRNNEVNIPTGRSGYRGRRLASVPQSFFSSLPKTSF